MQAGVVKLQGMYFFGLLFLRLSTEALYATKTINRTMKRMKMLKTFTTRFRSENLVRSARKSCA
eukprot:scaffold803_cov310-Pinguiococcus_pyrenoidosus.AAC.13